MIQSRICSYFKHTCTHASLEPTTFLSLPEDIRHRIYVEAGSVAQEQVRIRVKERAPFFCIDDLSVPKALDFGFHLYPVRNGVPIFPDGCGAGTDVYYTLRLVSLAVNADLARCICSYNEIVLYPEDMSKESLETITNSKLGMLQWIRRLNVSLNFSRRHAYTDHTLSSNEFEGLRAAWNRTVDILAQLPNIPKLDLKLIYETGNPTAAKIMLEPLQRLKVASCRIRLNDGPNTVLEDIAQTAVLGATSISATPQGPFRFLDLPTELRQHILGFTDLITPFREVEWMPNIGFSLQDHYDMLAYPCEEFYFCTRKSCAAPVCSCWRPPVPMFLVCQAMLQDVRAVFFSSNRFIVAPINSRKESFRASVFLTHIVPRECLAHLRDLVILFPCPIDRAFGIQRAVVNDWKDAIRHAAPDLDSLTLSLYIGTPVPGGPYPEDTSLKALSRVHEQIVRPLRRLRNLNGLFVRPWSPVDYTHWTEPRIERYFQKYDSDSHGNALVMGSTYDIVGKGKTARRIPKWSVEMYSWPYDEWW